MIQLCLDVLVPKTGPTPSGTQLCLDVLVPQTGPTPSGTQLCLDLLVPQTGPTPSGPQLYLIYRPEDTEVTWSDTAILQSTVNRNSHELKQQRVRKLIILFQRLVVGPFSSENLV